MKKPLLILAVAAVAAVGALHAAQECGTDAVLSGCVGGNDIVVDCEQSFSETYTVTADDVAASPGNVAKLCLVTTSTSLCPNTSAIATVKRNGGPNQSADLNDGETLKINAQEGDVLTIDVVQEARNNGTVCFRQGEVQFALVR